MHYNRQSLKDLNKEWSKIKIQERKKEIKEKEIKEKEIKDCLLESNTSLSDYNKDTFLLEDDYNLGWHKHIFSPKEQYDEEKDIWTKSCILCGKKVQYELI